MKSLINFSLLLLLMLNFGCMQTSRTSSVKEKMSNDNADSVIVKKDDQYIDFNCDCSDLQFGLGAIQGVDSIKNPTPVLLGECFGNLNYDILLYRKSELALPEVTGDSDCEIRGDIPDIMYFAFVIGKHENPNPENEFDTWDYDFPAKVKVYFKTYKTQWLYKDTYEVKDFKELGKLKYKMIGR